jgi:hypothetical protein
MLALTRSGRPAKKLYCSSEISLKARHPLNKDICERYVLCMYKITDMSILVLIQFLGWFSKDAVMSWTWDGLEWSS